MNDENENGNKPQTFVTTFEGESKTTNVQIGSHNVINTCQSQENIVDKLEQLINSSCNDLSGQIEELGERHAVRRLEKLVINRFDELRDQMSEQKQSHVNFCSSFQHLTDLVNARCDGLSNQLQNSTQNVHSTPNALNSYVRPRSLVLESNNGAGPARDNGSKQKSLSTRFRSIPKRVKRLFSRKKTTTDLTFVECSSEVDSYVDHDSIYETMPDSESNWILSTSDYIHSETLDGTYLTPIHLPMSSERHSTHVSNSGFIGDSDLQETDALSNCLYQNLIDGPKTSDSAPYGGDLQKTNSLSSYPYQYPICGSVTYDTVSYRGDNNMAGTGTALNNSSFRFGSETSSTAYARGHCPINHLATLSRVGGSSSKYITGQDHVSTGRQDDQDSPYVNINAMGIQDYMLNASLDSKTISPPVQCQSRGTKPSSRAADSMFQSCLMTECTHL